MLGHGDGTQIKRVIDGADASPTWLGKHRLLQVLHGVEQSTWELVYGQMEQVIQNQITL